jgi:hypothetical protein
MSELDLMRYYMDGPGEVLIADSDFSFETPDMSKILALITCKTASFRSSVTEEKVTGGRSIFPRRKYLTDRSIVFEMEDCEMDFRYVSMSQGEAVTTGASVNWAFGEDEQYQVSATDHSITLKETPIAGSLVLQFADGTLCTEDEAPASTGEYSIAANKVTFTAADDGKVVKAIYQYNTSAETKSVATLSTSIPKTVSIVHKMPAYDENNIVKGHQYIEIYKAQISGEFEEAYAEKAAFAPKLSFEVLDSKRFDKKMVDHRFVPVPAPVAP